MTSPLAPQPVPPVSAHESQRGPPRPSGFIPNIADRPAGLSGAAVASRERGVVAEEKRRDFAGSERLGFIMPGFPGIAQRNGSRKPVVPPRPDILHDLNNERQIPKKKKIIAQGPKKPKTAYNFYQLKERNNVCNEVWVNLGPGCNKLQHNAEVARIIGKRWRELPKAQRSEFQRLAAEDKLRYQRDVKEYEKMRIEQEGLQNQPQQQLQQRQGLQHETNPAMQGFMPPLISPDQHRAHWNKAAHEGKATALKMPGDFRDDRQDTTIGTSGQISSFLKPFLSDGTRMLSSSSSQRNARQQDRTQSAMDCEQLQIKCNNEPMDISKESETKRSSTKTRERKALSSAATELSSIYNQGSAMNRPSSELAHGNPGACSPSSDGLLGSPEPMMGSDISPFISQPFSLGGSDPTRWWWNNGDETNNPEVSISSSSNPTVEPSHESFKTNSMLSAMKLGDLPVGLGSKPVGTSLNAEQKEVLSETARMEKATMDAITYLGK